MDGSRRTPPERKTRAGDIFRGMAELDHWLRAGWWVYWNGKPKAPSILMNMPLKSVSFGVERGIVGRCLHSRQTTASGHPTPYRPEES